MTPWTEADYKMTYIALGAGVQSSALAVMSAIGEHNVPHADVAIFADTQDEPREVYEHLDRLITWLKPHGLRVDVVTRGKLSAGRAEGWDITIPAFSSDGGMFWRQCTSQFKIKPINDHIRKLHNLKPGQRYPKTRALFGIGIEEIYRMKPARDKWLTIEYPLIDAGFYRDRCAEYFKEKTGLPRPPRSACVFCPYLSDAEWRRMKEDHPDDFARAVEYDNAIRNMKPEKGCVYVHHSRKPLEDIDFSTEDQMFFNNECDGMCGV